MELKDLVKIEREKRGLTLEEASKETGINKFYLCSIENGKIPGMKTLKKIAIFTHKSYAEVYYIVKSHENN